jgi:hypothetical protein
MCDQKPANEYNTPVYSRDAKMRMLEWLEIITSGVFPSEQQLEHMLDRIEGTP